MRKVGIILAAIIIAGTSFLCGIRSSSGKKSVEYILHPQDVQKALGKFSWTKSRELLIVNGPPYQTSGLVDWTNANGKRAILRWEKDQIIVDYQKKPYKVPAGVTEYTDVAFCVDDAR